MGRRSTQGRAAVLGRIQLATKITELLETLQSVQMLGDWTENADGNLKAPVRASETSSRQHVSSHCTFQNRFIGWRRKVDRLIQSKQLK